MMNHQGVQDPLGDPKDGHILTSAIIDTIREPLIVLDEELRIIAASRSFYKKFGLSHETTYDKMFYDLGNGEWDVPALRRLLEEVIPSRTSIEDFEVVHDFLTLGNRIMLINACEIRYENGRKKMLLSINDITEQRHIESALKLLVEQKNTLLEEMRHRIANSLQLIASILLLKAEAVDSSDSRAHLQDAHGRIMSIATVQQHLDPAGLIADQIEVGPYLTTLCESLVSSMIGGRNPITLTVHATSGNVTSDSAISLGLLTTELVINALKHAFPHNEGSIRVSFESKEPEWTFTVEDNGIGYVLDTKKHGLGTSIVSSLARQLGADLSSKSSDVGTSVSLHHPQIKPL